MAFGRQAAGSGVGGVVKEVGVEQAAAGSQEFQYPLIDALDLMAVAQVVERLHGEHGVDRGCDLGWPLVLVRSAWISCTRSPYRASRVRARSSRGVEKSMPV